MKSKQTQIEQEYQFYADNFDTASKKALKRFEEKIQEHKEDILSEIHDSIFDDTDKWIVDGTTEKDKFELLEQLIIDNLC